MKKQKILALLMAATMAWSNTYPPYLGAVYASDAPAIYDGTETSNQLSGTPSISQTVTDEEEIEPESGTEEYDGAIIRIYMVDGEEEMLCEDDDVSFSLDDMTIDIAYDKNEGYLFPDELVGKTFSCTAQKEGYAPVTFDLDVQESKEIKITVSKKDTPSLQIINATMSTTDAGINLADYIAAASDFDGNLYVQMDDANTMYVSVADGLLVTPWEDDGVVPAILQDGLLIPLRAGSMTFTVRSEKTDTFEEAAATFTVKVEQPDYGTLSAADFTWSDTEYTFDGEVSHTISGVSSTVPGLTVNATVSVDDKTAGTFSTVIDHWEVTGEAAGNYLLPEGISGPDVTVKPLPVSVYTDDVYAVYGDDTWQALNQFSLPDASTDASLIKTDTPMSDAAKALYDSLNLRDYMALHVAEQNYQPGSYPDSISLSLYTIDDTSFPFAFVKAEQADGDVFIQSRDLGIVPSNAFVWSGTEFAVTDDGDITATGTLQGYDGMPTSDMLQIQAQLRPDHRQAGIQTSTIVSYEVITGGDQYTFNLDTDEGHGPQVQGFLKDFGEVPAEKVQWDAATFVYNAENSYSVTGSYTNGDDTVTLNAVVSANAITSGEVDTTIISYALVDGREEYAISLTGTQGPKINITPKEVSVSLKPFVAEYNSRIWQEMTKKVLDGDYVGEYIDYASPLTEAEQNALQMYSAGSYAVISFADGIDDPGEYAQAAALRIQNIAGSPFNFVVDEANAVSDVTITKAELGVIGIDDITLDQTEMPIGEGDTVTVSGEVTGNVAGKRADDQLTFSAVVQTKRQAGEQETTVQSYRILDGAAQYNLSLDTAKDHGPSITLDKINLGTLSVDDFEWSDTQTTYTTDTNLTVTGKLKSGNGQYQTDDLTIDANVEMQSRSVGLVSSMITDYDTVSAADIYDFALDLDNGEGPMLTVDPIPVTLDTDAITLSMHGDTLGFTKTAVNDTVVDTLIGTVSDAVYVNGTVDIDLALADALSDAAKTSYILVSAPDHASILTQMESAIQSIGSEAWSQVSTKDAKVSVPETDGTYILLVQTTDETSGVLYASNPIVLDQNAPSFTVDGIAENGLYYADVPISVTASDLLSDVEQITVSVEHDGKTTPIGSKTFDKTDEKMNVFVPDPHRIMEATVPSSIDSNHAELVIEASDRSGNSTEQRVPFSIDGSKVGISVSYDNNSPAHDRYFNDVRTATITYTGRHFDPARAMITIGINGEEKTMPIAEAAGDGIVMVEDRQDSQQDRDPDSYTDDRENTYILSFGNGDDIDVDYTVIPSYLAPSGENALVDYGSSTPETTFTIDKISPAVSLHVANHTGDDITVTDKSQMPYDASFVAPTVQVDERNIDHQGLTLSIKNSAGASYAYTGRWEDAANMAAYLIGNIEADGTYTMSASYTDLAGNSADAQPVYFTVDGKAPTGTITVSADTGSSVWSALLSTSRYFLFSKSSATAAINASDATSGVEKIDYLLYDPGDQHGIFNALTVSQLETQPWLPYRDVISLNGESQTTVYARLTDKAGNVSYIGARDSIIIDDTKPAEPTIDVQIKPSENGYYTSDIPFTVTVTEPQHGGTYAGLKDVTWDVQNGNEITQSGNFNDTLADRSMRVNKVTGSATISAEENNGNAVTIIITATDYAGNRTKVTKTLAIDTVAPIVKVAYNNNNPSNGKYFSNARTMTVTFTERNFDPDRATVDITIDGTTKTVAIGNLSGSGISVVSGRVDSEAGKDRTAYTDARTNTYVFAFGADGVTDHDYMVTPHATDLAGNTAQSVDYGASNPTNEFTIDEIAPVIAYRVTGSKQSAQTISYDRSNPYFDQTSTTVETIVTERNFAESGIAATVNAWNADGSGVSTSTSGTWSNHGASHTYTSETYTTDANYSYAATYTDLAGNSARLNPIYFTVDGTAPLGTVTLNADSGSATSSGYNRSVSMTLFSRSSASASLSASDATSGVADTSYYIYHPAVSASGTFAGLSVAELERAAWGRWTQTLTMSGDSQQIVYARVVDRAGNTSYVNCETGVIIDNTPPSAPVISLGATANGIYNGDVPFSFTANDVESGGTYSGLRNVEWTVTNRGARTQSGNAASSFSASGRANNYQGSQSISASSNNSNDVVVQVTATDWAGNTSTSYVTVKIDVTAPTVRVAYDNNAPVNGRYFKNARTVTITYTERNFDPSKAMVTLGIRGTSRTVSIEELSGSGITAASSRIDSQSGVGEQSYTDDRTNTYRFTFGADGSTDEDYTIVPSITDLAGNTSEEADYGDSNPRTDFTVDEVAPVLDLSLSGGTSGITKGGTSAESPIYDRASITPTIAVTERNHTDNGLVVTLSGTDITGKAVQTATAGTWTSTGDVHSFTLNPITEDGRYVLSCQYTDLAGNAVESEKIYFTVDKTAPTGVLTVSADTDSVVSSMLHATSLFSLFSKQQAAITLQTQDATSGMRSSGYYLYKPSVDTRGEFAALTQNQLESVTWTPWPGNMTITGDSQQVVYARMEDLAGNVAYINTHDGVIIDGTEPLDAVIAITTEASKDDLYNKDVPFTVTVADAENGGTYAGLKSIHWTVGYANTITQEGDGKTDLSDRTKRVQSVTFNDVISSKLNEDNAVVLTVTSEDWAGNVKTTTKQLAIDVTKPKVTVEYDNNDVRHDLYYNAARTATITVEERNFDPQYMTIQVTNASDPDQKTKYDEWKQIRAGIYRIAVPFDEDGDYAFAVTGHDKADNVVEKDYADHFVIDTVKPKVTVEYDNNAAANKIYYNAARQAQITVTEDNFDDALVTLVMTDGKTQGDADDAELESEAEDLTKSKDEANPETETEVETETEEASSEDEADEGMASDWIEVKDGKVLRHQSTIAFANDGVYAYTLQVEDLAGNVSDVYEQPVFVIDTAAPQITISGVEDKAAYTGKVVPVIEVADSALDTESMTATLTGARRGQRKVTGKKDVQLSDDLSADKTLTYTVDDMPNEEDSDDIWTLTASFVDLAGNEAESTIQYSVNRFGSIYTFDKDTSKVLDQYYNAEIGDVVIYETNVSGLKNQSVVVGKEGNPVKLTEGKNLTITDKSEDDAWTVLEYTIDDSVFKDEGLYEIIVTSVDDAGNRQDNALKDQPIAFVIDRTAPSVVVTGIEDNHQYRSAAQEFVASITDSVAMRTAEIYIDDKRIEKASAKDLQKAKNQLKVSVPASDDWQSITVKAEDEAGNITTEEYRVYVNTSWLALLLADPKRLAIYLAIIVAVASGGIFFWMRRKKATAKPKEVTKS